MSSLLSQNDATNIVIIFETWIKKCKKFKKKNKIRVFYIETSLISFKNKDNCGVFNLYVIIDQYISEARVSLLQKGTPL